MTEVGIKNDIGSLYDGESKQAFDAAATEGPDGTRSAPWLAIEAYAKKRDERWRDDAYCDDYGDDESCYDDDGDENYGDDDDCC